VCIERQVNGTIEKICQSQIEDENCCSVPVFMKAKPGKVKLVEKALDNFVECHGQPALPQPILEIKSGIT